MNPEEIHRQHIDRIQELHDQYTVRAEELRDEYISRAEQRAKQTMRLFDICILAILILTIIVGLGVAIMGQG